MKRIVLVLVLILLALILGGYFLLDPGGSGDSVQLDELAESGEEEVAGSTATLSGQEASAKATDASVDPDLAGLAEAGRSSIETGFAGGIQGRVQDPLSEPVAGASLYFYRSAAVRSLGFRPPILARAESDERGFFRMRGLELGSYVLRVEAESYAVSQRSIKLSIANPRKVGLLIGLRDGYALQGVVVDSKGKGLAGAWVVAGRSNRWSGETLLPEVRSDEKGRFTFTSLPQGKVYVVAWAEGRSLGVAQADASLSEQVRLELPEAGPFKMVFSLAEQKDDKADKPGDATVRIGMVRAGVRLPLPSPIRILKVPVKGESTTRGLGAGKYQLLLESEEVALKDYWRQQALTLEKPEVKLELSWMPKLPLHGRLVYKNGKPAQGIILLAQGNYGWQLFSAKSDEKGRFTLSGRFGLKARVYVSVKSPGFLFDRGESKSSWAQVSPGKEENLLTMLRVPLFSGRVVDGEGRPVKGARVWMHPPEMVRDKYGWATTDAKGEFSISETRIAKRGLLIDVKSESAFCPRPILLNGKPWASKTGLLLRLAEGAWVEGQVVDDKKIGIPGIQVRATFIPPPKPRDPKKRGRSWMYRQEARTEVSNREGRFRILGLSPGSWRISSKSKRLKRGSDPVVQLRAGEKKAGVRLVLGAGLSIRGRLVTDAGKPLAGAYIRARFDGKLKKDEVGGRANAQSGMDGSFTLKGLRAGTFVLTAQLSYQLQRELGLLERGPDGQAPMRARSSPKVKLVAGSKDYRWQIHIPKFGEIRARLAFSGPLLKHVQVLLRSGKQKWTFDRRLDQGVLSLQRVFTGSYEMTIKTPRFVEMTIPVQVDEGRVTNLGLLSLEELPQVEGRVMTAGGQSLSGVWISLDRWMPGIWPAYDITKGLEQFDGRVMTVSDARGYFRVPIKGRVRIFAFKPGYSPVQIVHALPKSKKKKGAARSGQGGSGEKQTAKAGKGLVLLLERAGEIQVRAPVVVKGQDSRWYVKLSLVAAPALPGAKRGNRSWSKSLGFKKGKPLRFLGLKPGTYDLQATNYAKTSRFTKKSVPGISYYERIQVQLGTNRMIRIP